MISLELGGAPHSIRNLWPQPWLLARRDDNGIEARLHWQVCKEMLTLRQAQRAEVAYKRAHGLAAQDARHPDIRVYASVYEDDDPEIRAVDPSDFGRLIAQRIADRATIEPSG